MTMKRFVWMVAVLVSPSFVFANAFAAPRAMAASQADAPAAPAPAQVTPVAGDTWKVTGDVQGTGVYMTCILAEKDHKLTGTCAGAGGETPRKLTGDVTDKGLAWKFDSEYQGTPITISMTGAKSEDGTKMTGTMAVDPMGVDGTFSAVKQ